MAKIAKPETTLLVGTTKGAFILSADAGRRAWTMSAPRFPGMSIYALAYDDRKGRHRLWAAVGSGHFGCTLHWSDDLGATWTEPELPLIAFPEDTKLALANIWQLNVPESDLDTLYAGVEPAALFVSRDAGASWSLVRGLHDHPHRAKWQPGGGGLALHTILVSAKDPRRIHIAVSTGGVYRSDNGGASWRASNQGVRAEWLPDKSCPEFGQCVHKVVSHPSRPSTLFLQNHWGLYRSDDAGDSWRDVAHGVPSDFGFAMATHPRDPDSVYIVPLESDQFRVVPEGKLRVYRTSDGGSSWQPLAKGLPQKGAFETVLRDGMCTDTLAPAGIYFGTRSGKLFGSRDEGGSWQVIRDGLPPIVCVKAITLAGAAAKPRSATKPTKRSAKPAASRKPVKARRAAPRKPARRGA